MHQNSETAVVVPACLPNAATRVNTQFENPAGNLDVYSRDPAPLSPRIMWVHALTTGHRVVPIGVGHGQQEQKATTPAHN